MKTTSVSDNAINKTSPMDGDSQKTIESKKKTSEQTSEKTSEKTSVTWWPMGSFASNKDWLRQSQEEEEEDWLDCLETKSVTYHVPPPELLSLITK